MMSDSQEDKTMGSEGLSPKSIKLLDSVSAVTTAIGAQAFKHPAISEFFRRQVRAQGMVFHVGLIDGSCIQVMPNQDMAWRKSGELNSEVIERRRMNPLEQKLVGSILDLLEQRCELMVENGRLERRVQELLALR